MSDLTPVIKTDQKPFAESTTRDLLNEASTYLIYANDQAAEVGRDISNAMSIEDDDQFIISASVVDKASNDFLVKCRDLSKYVNESRTPFTKRFDEIKKQFTEIENTLNGKTDGLVAEAIKGRKLIANRVLGINQKRMAEADLRRNKLEEEKRISEMLPSYIQGMAQELKSNLKEQVISAITSGGSTIEEAFGGSLTVPSLADFTNYVLGRERFIYIDIETLESIIYNYWNSAGQNLLAPTLESLSEALSVELDQFNKDYKTSLDNEASLLALKEKLDAENAAIAAEEAERVAEALSMADALSKLTVSSSDIYDEAKPTFDGSILSAVKVDVVSATGYATLFTHWFNKVGKNKSIDDLAKFKLGSLLVWAKSEYKKTGEKIECEGVVYFEEAKQQVRK